MINFFITGYPRSRTCWLANMFTYGTSYCFHELSKYGKTVDELKYQLNSRDETHVGTADCLAPYYLGDLSKNLENIVTIFIERDLDDVKADLENWLGALPPEIEKQFPEYTEKLEAFKEKYNPMIVKFKDLDKVHVLRKMWAHVGLSYFDEQRYHMLNELFIHPEKTKYFNNIKTENALAWMGGK